MIFEFLKDQVKDFILCSKHVAVHPVIILQFALSTGGTHPRRCVLDIRK